MSVGGTWSLSNEFGFYSNPAGYAERVQNPHEVGDARPSKKVSHADFQEGAYKGINRINALGYIPIVGIAMGILRITDATQNRASLSAAGKKVQVIRGVSEILGVGLLFSIPDQIVTIGREFKMRTDPGAQRA